MAEKVVDKTDKKRRGRGRPRLKGADDNGVVTREMVIDLAYEQARNQSLEDISFVQLAAALGVVPGSLHYHIGTKEDLTSAILNRFYKNLVTKLEAITESKDWRENIRCFARALMQCESEHTGVAQYIQTKPKFRLFQKVKPSETDYGAVYLDWAFRMFRDAGFSSSQTAMFYHVLALHCLAAANSAIAQLEPAAHESFLKQQAVAYSKETMLGLKFALPAFSEIRADEAFELGLEALLDRFATARSSEA